MNKEAIPTVQVGDETNSNLNEEVTELSEDIEVVSPGAMLRDARMALSLSQEHIASKLNFKVSLVKDIEDNIFDPSMPTTFNRGYLANYAKLVSVEVADVLASYDALDAATIQRSEMLSFSRETAKQAEHSRVMWLSYFIVAVLIGLTVLWWQQESKQQTVNKINESSVSENDSTVVTELNESAKSAAVTTTEVETTTDSASVINSTPQRNSDASIENASVVETPSQSVGAEEVIENTETIVPEISTAVFTFSGDCWVNIFDATGERIAWGVKKAGYVMTIQGKAPLKVTVGKPELTSIVFNDQPVDMSAFSLGNIAKFELPIITE